MVPDGGPLQRPVFRPLRPDARHRSPLGWAGRADGIGGCSWVDPEVKFAKPARLLKAGGWLALLDTEERYDDPLGSDLREMWAARSEHGDVRAGQRTPPAADLTGSAGWFGPPIERSHSQRGVLPAPTVLGVETTRATFLSWPEHTQQDFAGALRRHLQHCADVHLSQQTSLAMAAG